MRNDSATRLSTGSITAFFKATRTFGVACLALSVCSFALFAAEGKKSSKTEKPVPKHDAPDQLFRRAPMTAATRSVVIPLSTNVHLAFDAELLRTYIAWRGDSLNLYGPPYHGSSDRFMCDFNGETLWKTPQIYPWSSEKLSAGDSRTLPTNSSFKGISTKNGHTTLMYDVDNGTAPVRVHETPRASVIGANTAIIRRFEIAPSDVALFILLHAETGKFLNEKFPTVAIERQHDTLAVAVRATEKALLVAKEEPANYSETLYLEKNGKGPAIDRKTNHIAGTECRVYLKIPPHKTAATIEVISAALASKSDLGLLQEIINNWMVAAADFSSATNNSRSTVPSSAPEFGADKTAFPRLDGDKAYKVEHFPLPKEIDLRVTGMDFLPNGDLVVCSWAGDIYIVRNAQSDVQRATYRRFARGLIEPMGLKIINGDIYVAQKAELTRITDTDQDGEADLYQTINSGWGFTGRYNDFAFGPELDRQGNFYVFIGGNGAFWEVPYMGWAVKISKDGRKLAAFSSGLRVPNGFARFGDTDDIFVTENQGNWIGACKLNHLQQDKFYGFPSAWPAPQDKYERATNFAPPAIWFPYTLAKSASGIAMIHDDKFGPFKDQMIIGDFQLSVLTRVMLEKVNGEYQGAVWPFAKGFLSGINRVVQGPDGKLYVGGGKGGHWSGAVGPQLYSLDRVSYTGKTPFEVKEVHATSTGFELTFTQPVDAAPAANTDSYDVAQYTYKYHSTYGSPEFDHDGKENSSTDIKVTKATVSDDHLTVRLTLEGLRAGYVTMVRSLDVVNEDGDSLRHDTFWYTLNSIPK